MTALDIVLAFCGLIVVLSLFFLLLETIARAWSRLFTDD